MCGGKEKKKEKATGEHHIRAKRTGEYMDQGKNQIRCGLMCLASCIRTEAIEEHPSVHCMSLALLALAVLTADFEQEREMAQTSTYHLSMRQQGTVFKSLLCVEK